jgi:hypothetical protein
VSALAALALGGAVISQAGTSTPPQKSPEPATQQEQSAPNDSAADRDNVQHESGKDDGSEQNEKADGSEKAGSENPDDDGPGDHADEPANSNADHQFEGNE